MNKRSFPLIGGVLFLFIVCLLQLSPRFVPMLLAQSETPSAPPASPNPISAEPDTPSSAAPGSDQPVQPKLPPPKDLREAVLRGAQEGARKTLTDALKQLKEQVGDKLSEYQKAIFDFEAKKKEMEERIQKGLETAEQALNMAKAVRDLLYATSGYRGEIAREPLIWAAKRMLKAASPLQAVMFESEADLIEDFLTMPKDRDPVDWIDRASTKMQVRLDEMVKNLNKPAEEAIVKNADKFFGMFGTSFEEVSKIYHEQAEQSIARTMIELAKQEAVQEKLKDMAVNGKDWLKKRLKEAGNLDKFDDKAGAQREKINKINAEITQLEAKIRNLTQKKKAVIANRRIHMGYVDKGRDVHARLKEEERKATDLEEQRQKLFEAANEFPAAQNAWVEASEQVEEIEKQLGRMQTQSWAAASKQEIKQRENEQRKLQTSLNQAKSKQEKLRQKRDEAAKAKRAADALGEQVRKARANVDKLKGKMGSALDSSQDLEGENQKMDELTQQINAAKDELKDAFERRTKAADAWAKVRQKKERAQDVADLYEKGRTMGSRVFGEIDLPPEKAAVLIEKAEKGYEEALRTIEYCKQKKEQFEGLLQQAKQIAEVGKGFRKLSEVFASRMEDIKTIRKLISGGGVSLADLENAEISVVNFMTGSFGGMPQRCAAAMETIRGLDMTKLDAIFRDKIGSSLGFVDDLGSARLSQMKERLSTMGADFGKQLASFEKFNGFVKQLQKKFDKLEELWGGEKLEKFIKKISINDAYDKKVDELLSAPGDYLEKTIGKKNLNKIGKAAKFIAKFISKWDLEDPSLAWVSPGPGELAYYHDKPVIVSLIASDANSGINPNPDMWWFSIDGKRVTSDATLQRFKFQPKTFEEFYFLETRHREGVAQVIIPPPAQTSGRSELTLKGWVRDRAGHASNEVNQKFFLQYDPDPPEIKVTAPPSDQPAGKAGRSFLAKVNISDTISRIREKDVIFCISSAENPDKCWIYRGSDKSRVTFAAAEGSYSSAADASYQHAEVTFKTPEELKDGLYILTVRATNGAGMKNGVDHTFFIGDSYKDLVITPNFSPAKISFTSSETFDLRFTATNFSFMEIEDIEIKPHPVLPAGAPLERIASAETIVIRHVSGKSAKDNQDSFTVGVRTSDAYERFRVGAVKENKRYDVKYEYQYKTAGNPEWKKKPLNVPVYLQAEEATRPTFVQGNLYYQSADTTGKIVDELPVPRGTQLRISQIYKFPTFGGDMPKYVEQFIGYGQVRDDTGFFRVPVQLVGQSELRIRLVADALAVDDSQIDDKGRTVRKVMAAVAFPPAKIPYRCITEAFKLEEMAPEADIEGDVRGQTVYQVGRRTLPYHHYGSGGKERGKGITITWEGELSTGGFISPFGIRMQEGMFAASAFNAQANLLNPANPDMNGVFGTSPGLIW
ncbi:MAG TPA: hypothetical protein PKO06_04770, partial [Candidatus Ozemobacteraceae bacterium]|nr:hypothetical protein [Candidatus Ozemobacteraceae bacterium]